MCTQAASATGSAREAAHEALRHAEENLQAVRDKAAHAYEATKGKAYEAYEAGRDTAQHAAQAAVERAEAALQAARDKVGSMCGCHRCTLELGRWRRGLCIFFVSLCEAVRWHYKKNKILCECICYLSKDEQ